MKAPTKVRMFFYALFYPPIFAAALIVMPEYIPWRALFAVYFGLVMPAVFVYELARIR